MENSRNNRLRLLRRKASLPACRLEQRHPAICGRGWWQGFGASSRRPFLSNPSAVQGLLEDGVLTLWVDTEFTKNMVGTAVVLGALEKLAGTQTGRAVRCTVKVGAPPQTAPAEQMPAEHDHLDDLLAMGQQFDNIIIEE